MLVATESPGDGRITGVSEIGVVSICQHLRQKTPLVGKTYHMTP